ncbi:MAG: hypothetical protein LBI42_10975 [Chitinispirillales bacterium]|jgi:flagellin-specific chaperone FliS|nr:hypothetical protein [Chitinispirillales bacterium]
MSKAASRYSSMQILTSPLKRLICFMHRKAYSLIKSGIEEGSKRDLEKAQNLIFQLELALDKTDENSKVLAELYACCYYLLEGAEPRNIIAARKIIETLDETFNQLA